MGNFIRITPFMHVQDVNEAVYFFVEVLGFKAWIHTPGYAYVQREVAAVRILKASQTPGEIPCPGTRGVSILHRRGGCGRAVRGAEAEDRCTLEGAGAWPVDQEYGQREFMVLAPDGDLVVFGQSIFEMPVEKTHQ